jgi:hypothetical protein
MMASTVYSLQELSEMASDLQSTGAMASTVYSLQSTGLSARLSSDPSQRSLPAIFF